MESTRTSATFPAAASDPCFSADVPELPDLRQRLENFKSSPVNPAITNEDRALMAAALREQQASLPAPGLKPGERAPEFVLPNAFGQSVSLYDQLRKGPVILCFYRGAWCPYCNIQLRAMKESLPQFRRFGATLMAVTPQQPDRSFKQIEQEAYPFEILSDLDDTVMKNYGLHFELPRSLKELYLTRFGFDLGDYNGRGRYGLPVPATFVIDRAAIVRAASAQVDYTQRMQPSDILGALAAINAAGS